MPFDLPALRELFEYNRWATAKILECVAPLTSEELQRPTGGSFGSLGGTLVHACGADWVWLERLHGRSPRSLPQEEDLSSFEAIRTRWAAVEKQRDEYLAKLSPERLQEWLSYVNFAGESCKYRLSEVLFHIANHLTYHRGQVVSQLRQLGKPAAATDYLRLLDAQRS
jgi:uncharacterized damage-inducible protein DinB